MSNRMRWAVAIFILHAALVVGVFIGVSIWAECRESGHSAMYCWRMVTR